MADLKHITTWKLLDEMCIKYPHAVDDLTGLMDHYVFFAMGFTEDDFYNREQALINLEVA